MKTAIVFLLSVLVAIPALAGPPLNGTYKSTDLGGPMLTGRYSETWYGGPMMVNNTTNEQSWDGVALGTQWHWYCPWILSAPSVLFDNVDGAGNGIKIWQIVYTGGFCWLDGSGPWGGGDPDYLANINTWSVIATETYSGFVEVGTVRSVSATASFVAYNLECMALGISNTEKFGDTDGGVMPPDFPDFWDWFSCTNLGTAGPGEWGDVSDITFTITACDVIPVEETTWGAIKNRYSE